MHVGLQAQRPFSALQQTEATICRKNFIKPAQNNIPQRNTKTCVSAAVSVRSSFSLHLFVLVRQPPVGQGLIIHEVSRSHTKTHHSRQDSSGRAISLSQRPLPDNKHNTQNRQTSMLPVGFQPTISAGERPQTYAFDLAATGTGFIFTYCIEITN